MTFPTVTTFPAVMTVPAMQYTDVRELHGPIAIVRGVQGVGWDESCTVRLASGEVRHGVVLEVADDLAVVQMHEGTEGMQLEGSRFVFDGQPLRVPVGTAWLGRVGNGRGEPLDGGPPVLSPRSASVNGFAMNPAAREPPRDHVLTGVTTIDLLLTLVRGQKLPIFSGPGLPHLELATQVAAQATTVGQPFIVVFAGMGLTHADAAFVQDALEERAGAGELVLLLNTADDPAVERLLTPRIALTVAEDLAFTHDRHVLVVMTDMTSYCEALREVASARGEVPARRAYPGYLYSDLASLYERCGRLAGRSGSLTLMPVLSMPNGDITHPVPDMTGYITEGQIVLSPDAMARGTYPPIDPLASLSRLMRHGVGAGRTTADHLDVAAQAQAAMARGRRAAVLAELVGAAALSATDRAYLEFAVTFERDVMAQGRSEMRQLPDTMERAWRALATLPRRELTMLDTDQLDARGIVADRSGGAGQEPS